MALSGLGGDELFAGYPVFMRHLKLQQQKWIWNIPSPLRALAALLFSAIKKDVAAEKMSRFLRGENANLENTFPVFRQIGREDRIKEFLIVNNFSDDAVREIVKALLSGRKSSTHLLSDVSISEISTYMQNVLLRDTDQMSMAVALEVRVPFLDYKLVEYVLGVNDAMKIPTFPKKLFVDSMGDLLPSEVVHRPKMGFVFPWAVWLKKDLKNLCEEKISNLAERKFIQKENLLNQWQQFLNNDPGIRWLDMWLCVVLEHWMEKNNIEE
jgi:asparagine synthase (glutamine-hydrolysing)